ncbi:hypothetical protein PRIPAC_83368 [Pristionchus pacificus]|uniref:Uncharacterized protein n=1 Tax=Pristionchus pacificus TaxID=54126 RepID=A0A2A6BTP3_PRIPA|nr:hypothetical protein PRIPAC_83368 [Pristionchus pacificus]|eukprot:PDM69352.1 hypothetical protein PRIPAC_47654 [Pristionchus pacificus]
MPLICSSFSAVTCYTRFNSSRPYPVIGSDTVDSQRGCEVLCTANSQCTAFAFSPRGLQSWCDLLGSPSTNTCTEPKEVFLRKEQITSARTNITAEFGEDPCIDEIERSRGSAPICSLDPSKRLTVRVIAENGSRITQDNDVQ